MRNDDMPELRVPYDYVLPHRPRGHLCRLCGRAPRLRPPRSVRLHFRMGWTTEVEVCEACHGQARAARNPAHVIPHMAGNGRIPPVHRATARAVADDETE